MITAFFILSIVLLLHTYLLYPLIMYILFKIKGSKSRNTSQSLEAVSILMSVYNEEKVIAKKLESIINSDYPIDKLEILIGSDGSSDKTDNIILKYSNKYPQIKFKRFGGRNGKPSIIEKLKKVAVNDILIITDANVFFKKNTIKELVKHFNDPKIGLVDSRMTNTGFKKEGISIQEKGYINMEGNLKYFEGELFNCLIGPFGGCYAIRKSLLPKVPKTFRVDDFFICMHVLESGYFSICERKAIVHEDVSNIIGEEFRRKSRIATGNIQNFIYYKHLLISLNKTYVWCYISHKVIRWLGPILLISMFSSNLLIQQTNILFKLTLLGQCIFYTCALFDQILKNYGIHSVLLRYTTHFVAMNAALFMGIIEYLKGVKTNVWEPTKRYQ